MPWIHVDPDEFFTMNDGTLVFHVTSRHSAWMDCHYQIESNEEGWMAFDVRDLAYEIYETVLPIPEPGRKLHQQIIEEAAGSLSLESLEEVLIQTGIWYEGETR